MRLLNFERHHLLIECQHLCNSVHSETGVLLEGFCQFDTETEEHCKGYLEFTVVPFSRAKRALFVSFVSRMNFMCDKRFDRPNST